MKEKKQLLRIYSDILQIIFQLFPAVLEKYITSAHKHYFAYVFTLDQLEQNTDMSVLKGYFFNSKYKCIFYEVLLKIVNLYFTNQYAFFFRFFFKY